MAHKNSTKTMIIFWLIAIPLLVLWYFALQWIHHPKQLVTVAYNTSRVLPVGEKYDTALEIMHYMLQEDHVERTYLVLLQNNMELRPGGGYIGSFAIIKVKDGAIIDSSVHDTANFDGRIPDTIATPYPMYETMHISAWKLRDSNWMPDFPSNARLAESFYRLGGGEENFDGIFAVNATILDTILSMTGPIKLKKYPDVYKSGDAILTLEYQVERGYKDQDIAKGDRKVVMDDLADAIIARITRFSFAKKMQFVEQILALCDNKDIQLFFRDKEMMRLVRGVGWDGTVDRTWEKDYLMVVDANLASYKTDAVVTRAIDYDVDLSGSIPQAVLQLTYENHATQKDWKTNDYQTYVRVYMPYDAWVTDAEGCIADPQYGVKFGRRYVGCLAHTKLGTTSTVTVRYNLPMDVKNDYPYNLKIQKQSGVHDIPVTVHVTKPGATVAEEYDFVMNRDVTLVKTR